MNIVYVILREFSFQPVSTLGLGSTTRNLLLPEMGAEAGNKSHGDDKERKERKKKQLQNQDVMVDGVLLTLLSITSSSDR